MRFKKQKIQFVLLSNQLKKLKFNYVVTFLVLLTDTTKLSNIHIDSLVKIKIRDENRFAQGLVYEIFSKEDDPNGIYVLIDSGDDGNVVDIINDIELVKSRILNTESHISDNKEDYYEPVMANEVIPQAIQAFLNSDGGYVYVGAIDDAKTETEKFKGLEEERKICELKLLKNRKIQLGEKLTMEKFKDIYQDDIEKNLDKYLSCNFIIHKYVHFDYFHILGKDILQISIDPGPSPVFYRNISSNNKPKVYRIYENNEFRTEKVLDEFYYRNGSKKRPITTFEEFYSFWKNKRSN